VNGLNQLPFASDAEPALSKGQRRNGPMQARNFWDVKTSRDADSPETHDRRFDAETFSLPGK